ncbi:Crp/Fnr family transcriptional regulator [Paenibacillus thermoaerophilus]|uniref:Crp/Fnr family transcriptional regulator n=1 Tax=Paenibacillus thermoaerophilus TaxID=1215385 RepID=A0ABW2V2A2_9BACL|nr:Crp/Fnr family transcriptional regulator [Paenibacillus thermoaerophilus]TMV18183.1 Crp/Fnr family transcriptional regulator [Paenibacillus thermoaerophilus]
MIRKTAAHADEIAQQSAYCEQEGGIPLLSGEPFRLLQSVMYDKKAEAGSCVVWEGDPTGKLYYIRSGRIKLIKTTEEGSKLCLSVLGAGDLFGELTLMGGSTYGYGAEAIEDTELGVIQEKDLEILLHRHGDLAVAFAKWMSLQHGITQSKFRDLLMFGKPGALASTLIRLANTYGVAKPDGIRIGFRLTHTELGEMIGATRESVNRMLSELKANGIVEVQNGYLTIRSLQGLKALCQCPSFPACPKEICRI